MRTFVKSLFLIVPAIGLLLNIAYSDDKALHKEIESLYGKVSNLMVKKDFSALAKMMTDDCTFTDAQGRTINRQQWETIMKQQMGNAKNVKCFFKVSNINTKNNLLMVTSSWDISMDIPGEQGKMHKMRTVGSGVDTLVKTKDGWKLKMAKTHKEHVTIDGKVVDMGIPSSKPAKKK